MTPDTEAGLPELPPLEGFVKNDGRTSDRVWIRIEQVQEYAKQYALTALSQERADAQRWSAMVYAPLDGSEVELMIRHRNYWLWLKSEKKIKGESWEQVVRGQWLDHNGGGWSWHGMAGTPIGWRAIDIARSQEGTNG
jgi:hypothetical protein